MKQTFRRTALIKNPVIKCQLCFVRKLLLQKKPSAQLLEQFHLILQVCIYLSVFQSHNRPKILSLTSVTLSNIKHVVIGDMVKRKLRVTTYELRVTSYKLRVESLKARINSLKVRVKIQKCEFISTSSEFKFMITSSNSQFRESLNQ